MLAVLHRTRRRGIALFVAVTLLPVFGGCSQLGIATTDDLEATESRLQNSNRTTNSRLDSVEQASQDYQATLNTLAASVDTLNVRFARAKEWLQTMNLDTISKQANDASAAAIALEEQNRVFLAKYIGWLKAQQALIAEQITVIEAKLQTSAAITGSGDTQETDDGESSNDGN